jgi:hypothetical protein
VGCGISSGPHAATCDPTKASEVRKVTVKNTGGEDLHEYAVAVSLDKTNFDFTIPAKGGSDLAVWDEATKQAMPEWLESYDPVAEKALLWVKLATLAAGASQPLLVTAGTTQVCTAAPSSGYSVFPFFSDVSDVPNWRAINLLRVTNTVVQGPLTISGRSVIESDGNYNATPGLVQATDGELVLSYLKTSNSSSSILVILRRSQDLGATWSPEAVYFDASKPDPGLARTPLGDLLISFVKINQSGQSGGAYSRSTDNGMTWGPFTFFGNPPPDAYVVNPLLNIGQTMYGGGYGSYAEGTGFASSVWSSADDGFTWTRLSVLREQGDPGLNELALAQTAPCTLLAVMRTDNGLDTFGRYSGDLGMTWGPLISYTAQVGVLQDPEMIQAGAALILLARDATRIPGVQPALTLAYPRQFVAFVSYDGGQTFAYGTVLDTYTGEVLDGGYSWPILLPDGQVYVVYYADSHNLRQPDIKSVTLTVTPPTTVPANSIHVVGQLAAGQATRSLNVNATRYALEFRFHSNPIPAGSQFSVVLQGQTAQSVSNLVDWELPSTHAADPTADSGIISNGQFVQVLNSFTYGQVYRLRTVVDEGLATQQASVLDEFGVVISTTRPLPLAESVSHAATIAIGNDSAFRTTDTLLDFVFVRPAAQTEPTVTVANAR